MWEMGDGQKGQSDDSCRLVGQRNGSHLLSYHHDLPAPLLSTPLKWLFTIRLNWTKRFRQCALLLHTTTSLDALHKAFTVIALGPSPARYVKLTRLNRISPTQLGLYGMRVENELKIPPCNPC